MSDKGDGGALFELPHAANEVATASPAASDAKEAKRTARSVHALRRRASA